MNCRKVQSLASAYIDGELAGVEMLAVRRHLSECADCAGDYESLLKMKRMFGALRPKRPVADLADRICRQLDEVQVPAYERALSVLRGYIHPFPVRIRATAAGLAVFAALLMIRASTAPVGVDWALTPNPPWSEAQAFAGNRTLNTVSATNVEIGLGTAQPVHTVDADPWFASTGLSSSAGGSGFHPVMTNMTR